MDKVHAFYCRKPWKELSYRLKVERGGRCARCNFVAVTKEGWAYLIGHHTVELDDEKVDDPAISLNPDLVEIICLDCHNKEHRRFGHQKHVYRLFHRQNDKKHGYRPKRNGGCCGSF